MSETLLDTPGAPAAAPAAPAQVQPTTPAAVEPYYKDWLQSDGTLNAKALDRLPEHLAHLKPTLERQTRLDDVLGVFANQALLAGKKGLQPLPENAPDNVKAERKALMDSINGVPKDLAAYAIKRPDNIPEAAWNPKLVDNVAKWAHKNSISPAQINELTKVQFEVMNEQIASQKQYEAKFFSDQDDKFTAAIKFENIAPDKAQQLVERGAQRLGLDLTKPEVGFLLKNADARMMAMRHAIATGEDKFIDGNAQTTASGSSSEQAQDIIRNKANPDYEAYWNKDGTNPRAKAVREKVEGLLRGAAARAGR